MILILTLHELGTCFPEVDLSVPSTEFHLMEMSKICTILPDWNASSDSYDWSSYSSDFKSWINLERTECDASKRNYRTGFYYVYLYFIVYASWHFMSWSCELNFSKLWVIFGSKIRSINVPMSKSIFGFTIVDVGRIYINLVALYVRKNLWRNRVMWYRW